MLGGALRRARGVGDVVKGVDSFYSYVYHICVFWASCQLHYEMFGLRSHVTACSLR